MAAAEDDGGSFLPLGDDFAPGPAYNTVLAPPPRRRKGRQNYPQRGGDWREEAAGGMDMWQGSLAEGEGWPKARHPLYHPSCFKKRFCASFPNIASCRRAEACAFAHSREELRTPLLSLEEEAQDPAALTEDFFLYKFKTLWCPIGVQHDWQTCVYAHNYQDARRKVEIGYGSRACPYWSKHSTDLAYAQRCPLGVVCRYAHGAKEQLYHPQHFRTAACCDRTKACPRKQFCVYFHKRSERRKLAPDNIDYQEPLPAELIDKDWEASFLTPPFPSPGDGPGGSGRQEVVMGACSPGPLWFMPGAAADDGRGRGKRPQADAEDSPRTQSTTSGTERNEGELFPHDWRQEDGAGSAAWPVVPWMDGNGHMYVASSGWDGVAAPYGVGGFVQPLDVHFPSVYVGGDAPHATTSTW